MQNQLIIKKLLYQSKNRSCKEMDLILGTFVDKYLAKMNNQELIEYTKILAQDDFDLYVWYTNRTWPSFINSKVMQAIISCKIY